MNGYRKAEDAARAANKRHRPLKPDGRTQGGGGWFWLGGRHWVQGLDGLAAYARVTRMIVERDGRWYDAGELEEVRP